MLFTAEPHPDPDVADLAELRQTGLELNALLADLRADLVAASLPVERAIDVAERLVAAYDRNARAVRRTIMLARHIQDPAPQKEAATQAAAKAATEAATQAGERAAERREIIRRLEDMIEPDPDAAALRRELQERLDGPELDEDQLHLSTDTIVDRIRRDLGLTINYETRRRRTPADIASLHARARAPCEARPEEARTDEARTEPPPQREPEPDTG